MNVDEKPVSVGNVCPDVPGDVDRQLQAPEGRAIRAHERLEHSEQE